MAGDKNFVLFILLRSYALFGIERHENLCFSLSSTAQYIDYVIPIMKNIKSAITSADLQDQIKVSTATYSPVVSNLYPPSNGSLNSLHLKTIILNKGALVLDKESQILSLDR